MATIIALTNQKGGVGKTTTSSALAAGLATFYNKKVLAVDLDPQGSLGFSLGLDIENCRTVYDVLTGQVPVREAIQTTDYCDILTSNILLSSAELEFTTHDRKLLLKNALAEVADEYDYVVIDTPPALNVLTVNAYAASNYLIIPMNVLGIILTKFNKRTLLAREVKEMAENVAAQMGSCVFGAQVRASVSVAEAPAHGISIFEHSPRSKPAEDYREFVGEVIKMTTKGTIQEVM